MPDALIVFCTCGTNEEAERLARTLVEERLAACVNILPPVRSIYRWQGTLETTEEVLLLIKTRSDAFAAMSSRIQALHSYDTPEIAAVRVAEGSERYLRWLSEQCGGTAY